MPEHRTWHTCQNVNIFAFVAGASFDHDLCQLGLGADQGQKSIRDVHLAMGLRVSTECVLTFMRRTDKNPMLLKLGRAIDLEPMTKTKVIK